MTTEPLTLLTLPLEIRLRIYDHLFASRAAPVPVEAEAPTYQDNSDGESDNEEDLWKMRRIPNMSAQMIRVCRQIHSESARLLYSTNTFDVAQREALKLLRKTIGDDNMKMITSILLDWDALTDFAWSLAKSEFVELTCSITTLSLATWRTRVLGGQSFLWRDVKSYERQLCQSATEILAKSKKLRLVAQRPYHRLPKQNENGGVTVKATDDVQAGMDGVRRRSMGSLDATIAKNLSTKTTYRIKWRFLASEAQMWPEEDLIDLHAELAVLRAGNVDPNEERRSMIGAIDPV